MLQDLPYSLRALAKHPSFALVAVLVLGLAVGVNTAVFSLINSLLLRPLPVRAPEELAFVYSGWSFSSQWVPELRQKTTTVFSALATRSPDRARLRTAEDVLSLQGEAVSGNYFDLLGMWRAHFNADPTVLGRTITINCCSSHVPTWRAFTVIGVAAPDFNGTRNPWQPTQYWVLIRQRRFDYEAGWGLIAEPIGRLAPGVSFATARVAVDAAGRDILGRSEELRRERTFELRKSPRVMLPFTGAYTFSVPRIAVALMAVAMLLLVVAATNLAGMLMARGISRRSEIAVRLSLGAGRLRLMRQLLTESLLLATGGSLVGLVATRRGEVCHAAARRVFAAGVLRADGRLVSKMDASGSWHRQSIPTDRAREASRGPGG